MSDKSEFMLQLNQIQAIAASAIESIHSLKPMFKIKSTNETVNTNNQIYTHIIGFENVFESKETVHSIAEWMRQNWTISITASMIYIFLVFSGKYLMQQRDKFELRKPLIMWNIFLAIFSILGTVRVWPDFIYTLSNHGFVHSICNKEYAYGITGFWSFMFVMSKLPELIDTLFIVLRKQELIFLHWYHHATVLIYCFYSYPEFTASGRWFMTMNYFVHSMMYSYYACKAMRIRVPKFISQMITTSQIVQMIIGCYVNYVAYDIKVNSNAVCHNSFENIKYSSLMYLSYFVLFANFFIQAYIVKKKFNKPTIDRSKTSAKSTASPCLQKDENNNVIRKAKKID